MRGPILSLMIAAAGCSDAPEIRPPLTIPTATLAPESELGPDVALAHRLTQCILDKGAIPGAHDLIAELKTSQGGKKIEAGVVVPGANGTRGVNINEATLQVEESDGAGQSINFRDGNPATGPDALWNSAGSSGIVPGTDLPPEGSASQAKYQALLRTLDVQCAVLTAM